MIYINKPLLAEFNSILRCEYCSSISNTGHCDPHHIIARGHGGGSRLDLRFNLVALCRYPCHQYATDGKLPQSDFWFIVSRRQGCKLLDIEPVLRWLLRLDKDSSAERIEAALSELGESAAELARRVLKEIGR